MNEMKNRGETPISYQEGEKLCEKINAMKYCECSSKTRDGLKNVFDEAIRAALFGKKKKKKESSFCLLL